MSDDSVNSKPPMDCPKCRAPMEAIEFGADIEVRRCTGCRGLFCKWQALQQLRDEWLSDVVLDKGSATHGAKQNEMQDVPCPACGTIMESVQDRENARITLDSCPGCNGVFLDAGELTNMKSVTLMDHVRHLLAKLGR